jgi:hypothetical protein
VNISLFRGEGLEALKSDFQPSVLDSSCEDPLILFHAKVVVTCVTLTCWRGPLLVHGIHESPLGINLEYRWPTNHPTRSANQQMCQDCSYRENGFPFIPNSHETRISQKYIHPFHTIRRKLSRLTSQKPLQRKSQECWGGKRRVHIGLVIYIWLCHKARSQDLHYFWYNQRCIW